MKLGQVTNWLALGACVFGVGCGGGGDPETSRAPGAVGVGATGGSSGASGGAGMSGTAGTGDFGNMDIVPPPPAPTVDAGMTCAPGMRCMDETTVDVDDCGSQTLETEIDTVVNPGNVLLVFDRSGSMSERWEGQTQRWEAAGTAIAAALEPLADILTVGTVFFPSPDPNAPATCIDPTGITCIFLPGLVAQGGTCSVNAIGSGDQLPFQPGADFLATFSARPGGNGAPVYAPVPGGFTPLKEGLQQAQAAIAAGVPEGITSVIVITDGDPNCAWDQAVSLQIVQDWQAAGIRTYVIGLPGGVSGQGTQVLNALASAGGTGSFITPADPAALAQQLRDIATETIKAGIESCEIELVPPAEAPEKLHLVVTEGGSDSYVPRDLGMGAGWTLNADASLVTFQGSFCDDALAGRFDSFKFEFGCVDPPPLPPLEGPM